jgi:N-methylhydantoinase A
VTLSVGIDVGGTFTDFIAIDDGVVSVFKHLTTPSDPSVGVLDGVVRFAEREQISFPEILRIIHGTTLVANSLIERRGARTALVTTTGFRDVLEIGREARYDLYDLDLERPEPLIPRPLRLEVRERMLADGTEAEPLDPDAAAEVARTLVALKVESVAVCLLHAYANPAHERELGRIIAAGVPGIDITLSSDIAPEWREFERTSTAAANAFVRPLARRYLAHLENGFEDLGAGGRLYVMMSQGGVTSASLAADMAIHLVESGPAGGVIAAGFFGGRLGLDNLISFDMGGTTAKVSLIEHGVPLRVPELEVARVARFKRGSGLPLKLPTIEMIEIGTGGGSIGHRGALGLLKVGPKSAGADPGPACYGTGTAATVTDADLHLGFLNPAYFLGGSMALYPESAESALNRLGIEVGMDAEECARGIFDIVNRQMALAMRTHVVERGHDPRDFALVAFGGAGPLHAYEVARHLGIGRVICPPAAGVASALGFLISPFSIDLAWTHLGRLGSFDWAPVVQRFHEMENQARDLLKRGGADLEAIEIERRVDMRYAGQGYEVPVPLPTGILGDEISPDLREAFNRLYRSRFGTALESAGVECVHWRLTARVPVARVDLSFPGHESGDARKGERRAFFPESNEYLVCPVLDRYRLTVSSPAQGPALIEERESTIVVGPSATWQLDGFGNVQINFSNATNVARSDGPKD